MGSTHHPGVELQIWPIAAFTTSRLTPVVVNEEGAGAPQRGACRPPQPAHLHWFITSKETATNCHLSCHKCYSEKCFLWGSWANFSFQLCYLLQCPAQRVPFVLNSKQHCGSNATDRGAARLCRNWSNCNALCAKHYARASAIDRSTFSTLLPRDRS